MAASEEWVLFGLLSEVGRLDHPPLRQPRQDLAASVVPESKLTFGAHIVLGVQLLQERGALKGPRAQVVNEVD